MPDRSHHNPIPGEIPVPHGVQEYDTVDGRIINDIDDFQYTDKSEKEIFAYLLQPADAYTPEGVYWADLPFGKKVSFVTSVDSAEAKKELKTIGRMFKEDPLSPVAWYFRNCVLPGAGLGLEGYVLFSIGNVSSLFSAAWPECWGSKATVCNKNWIAAVSYLEIVGIIFGQVIVGFIGDGIGRKWGLIQDASIMFIGLIMLTASWGVTLNGWVICYAWSLFFYSVGVGGEYPMTATSGMERGTRSVFTSADDRLHRGRKVLQAFLMQGWGQFFNQVILILLLLIFHHGSGNPPYSKVAVQWTFRIAFAIPAIGTLWLVYYRAYKMPYPSKDLEAVKKKSKVTGYDVESLKLVLKYFGPRLLATTGAWFANDVFFYGNKLFQGQFIAVIAPNDKSVILGWLYNLINIGVSLAGYYLAAFLIDNKLYGRNRMMQVGFLMDFILFVIPAFHYKYYTAPENVAKFQTMYFLSSFFNQFGPNAVTFLVAAEVYPTQVRATAHGISAACGKLGALFASVVYSYISVQTRFYLVPWFGLAGMLVTFVFMPDTTGLDLREQDRRFQFIREGRDHEYHGIAVHPQHLSLWERFRGVGKNYNPELDYKQKVDELRSDWEERQKLKAAEGDNASNDEELTGDYSPDVHQYFVRTSPLLTANKQGVEDNLKLPEAATNEKL
ncbi:phosphate transporter PHO84 [Sugiyamaella lignohabitans]|uniref:Phosphate transporter PHO84 n=1 Tax=Sugiyamaella lignohabitans TaxID=796027 RepID=A0A167EER0_9ASCO|nr:phosphate transporter PHO84 [Sugiyamaella lignohabitans]ANB13984.1 phosphate transporter PHO84 [Sugiyamaella lignohabitans]